MPLLLVWVLGLSFDISSSVLLRVSIFDVKVVVVLVVELSDSTAISGASVVVAGSGGGLSITDKSTPSP